MSKATKLTAHAALTFLLALVPFAGMSAQETAPGADEKAPGGEVRVPQFGYLSYNDVFEQMPEYAEAKARFEELKAKYDAEAQRAEDEFQRKFAEFLQGQKDFPPSIMQKRQVELQELMDKSVSFRQESQRLLQQAQADLQAAVSDKLNAAIQAVAAERGLIFVLNTDGNAVPFIHPQVGVNITSPVLQQLGIK